VNGDSAVIADGHTVTFDVDQSGWANGLAGLTITGTLICSTEAGDYYLKCAADISGTGLFQAGSAQTDLPITTTLTIDFASTANSIELADGLDLQLFCTEPTNKIIRLSGPEAAGQTELSVDTDVTGDIWKAGDTVHINDIDNGSDSEERIIASGGIAAGAITVTAGLTNAKIQGALVILVTRNIKITGSTDYAIKSGSGANIGCEISGNVNGIVGGSNQRISGVLAGHSFGINGGAGNMILAAITKGTYGIYGGVRHTIIGTISGCSNGIFGCHNLRISGLILGNTRGVRSGGGHIISGTTFKNTYDLYEIFIGECFNVLFGGTTENYNYNASNPAWVYVASQDHDQVADAFKAWCRGGIVTSETASPPDGYSIYYQHACEDADYPCFRQVEVALGAGATLEAMATVRIENGKDHSAYKPRLQIIDKFSDPLVDSNNSALAEDQVATAVGDGSTWQDLEVSWENTGDTPRKLLVRIAAKHADSIVDEVWEFGASPIEEPPSGGGGVTPVIELIAAEIADRIDEITVANTFNQDLVAVRPKRNDFKDIPPENGKVLIWQGDEAPPDAEAIGTEAWLQEFLLIALVIDSDAAETSIDTRINQVRADIEKKLKDDHTRGGNAIDTKFGGSVKFDEGGGFTGIAVQCIVHYRTEYSNPYEKG